MAKMVVWWHQLRAVDRDRLMKRLGALADAKLVEVFSVLQPKVAE